MTEQVKRYHKSCLGIMEQSNDGEWVQSKDFESLKQQQETASNNAKYYANQALKTEEELETYKGFTKELEKACKEKSKKLAQANKIVVMYRCIMLFVIVIGVVVEVIGAYHG